MTLRICKDLEMRAAPTWLFRGVREGGEDVVSWAGYSDLGFDNPRKGIGANMSSEAQTIWPHGYNNLTLAPTFERSATPLLFLFPPIS